MTALTTDVRPNSNAVASPVHFRSNLALHFVSHLISAASSEVALKQLAGTVDDDRSGAVMCTDRVRCSGASPTVQQGCRKLS